MCLHTYANIYEHITYISRLHYTNYNNFKNPTKVHLVFTVSFITGQQKKIQKKNSIFLSRGHEIL